MVAAGVTVIAANADGRGRADTSVRLADGDRASGLACMLASLLEDNLRDFRTRAFVARLTRGDVVLLASDSDIAVTLSFRPGEVVIGDGPQPGAPVLAGKWLDMAKLCSGRRSPFAAMTSGELRLTPGRKLRAVAGAGFALSVPKSFYDENRETFLRRRRGLIISLTLLAAVMLTAVTLSQEHSSHRPCRRRAHGRVHPASKVP